jgi:hypothetical protein
MNILTYEKFLGYVAEEGIGDGENYMYGGAEVIISPVNKWYNIEEKHPKYAQRCLICVRYGEENQVSYEYRCAYYLGKVGSPSRYKWGNENGIYYAYSPERFRWQAINDCPKF